MKPLPWSHSALSNFLSCPKQYYHLRIAKDVQQEQGEAALWGDYVHKAFEVYLKGGDLSPDLEGYREYLDKIKKGAGEMSVECKYAVDKNLSPCSFFDQEVWCRGIFDVLHLDGETARVIDHKTGKMKPGSKQLKLSALLVFAHHPEVTSVKTGFFWLKDRQYTGMTYTREEESVMWSDFLPDLLQYKQAFKTDTFNPRPSGLCNGWCPVTDCEYWKPKRRP